MLANIYPEKLKNYNETAIIVLKSLADFKRVHDKIKYFLKINLFFY